MLKYTILRPLERRGFKRLLRGAENSRCLLINASRSFSSDAFLSGDTSPYFEQMYESWKNEPSSVHASWQAYFSNISKGVPMDLSFSTAPPLSSLGTKENMGASQQQFIRPTTMNNNSTDDTSKLIRLVQAYQAQGYEFARIDPLKLPEAPPFVSSKRYASKKEHIDFRLFGFTDADLDRTFQLGISGMAGFLASKTSLTLRQLVQRLEETYCGTIGVEVSHIVDPQVKNYILDKFESPNKFKFDTDMKKRILKRTMRSCLFESFCGTKFNTSKRFGVDGCETSITAVKSITKQAVKDGIHSVVIGMPHRGRLNVLMNVLHKPMRQMVCEFQGVTGFGGTEWGNTGDVKYHLGVDYDHFDQDAKRWVHLSVAANPSHLEAVDPVVIGNVRAKQYYTKDTDRTAVLPVLLHGDASFAGQGVVYETLQMSQLPSYTVGGTIHLIVNNQIGFTTNVGDQGSGRFCTDIAKFIEAPILHVNADDPEACTFAALLALEYRQKFHGDVFLNMVGYRRYGHNELDMPKFTQPIMYNIIAKHPVVMDIYAERLIKEKVVTQEEVEEMKQSCTKFYTEQYEESKKITKHVVPTKYTQQWKHMAQPSETCPPQATGVSVELLKDIGNSISHLPEEIIKCHPTIKRVYKAREEAIKSGENIDFGLAEALAFGTLLNDGFHVRLAGQDAQRGTFSHRHSVVHDQTIRKTYCPLAELVSQRKLMQKFEVCNSLLSEYAALGYEIGYALEHPDTLAIWEAQFGDFCNGAQITIDQFIAAGEAKWGNQCGIVLLLPHGYDGQGPEHSSARIERFLQLCDDREDVINPNIWSPTQRCVIQKHNFQVVNCSTPANFFHMLRRQVHRGFRKPLVCISAKRMLKMRATFSRLAEMTEGTQFLPYIPNNGVKESERPLFTCENVEKQQKKQDPGIERLILCSGQVYYDLAAYREKHGCWNVAIARVEQLSPFPFDQVVDDVRRYPNLRQVVWAQEEPMNAGPWSYTSKRITSCLKYLNHRCSTPLYVGRDVSAAPAGGDAALHQDELDTLLKDAFDLNRKTNSYYEKYIVNSTTMSKTSEPIVGKNKKKRSTSSPKDVGQNMSRINFERQRATM